MRSATQDLELVAVSKRFGDVIALDAAHFHLRPGTVHALLGENGAGKTTLMRIAYGLLKADAGTIRLNGQPTDIASPAAAIAHGLAMVQQHFSLVPAMTAVENFALGGRGRFDRSREARRLADCAAPLGLAIPPDVVANTMSIAAQQQLEIAKALGHDCQILILDEPTSVLTPVHAASLLEWIRGYADQGRSVVLITHKLRDAISFADDVTVLRNGRTVLQSRVTEVEESDLLSAMLGAPPLQMDTSATRRSNARGGIVASLRSVAAVDSRGRERLADVSLEINAGEIVGVAGLDGSGHRLLLRLLAGRGAPSRGSVQLPTSVAFIPEDRQREAIALDLDLRENVALRGAGARRGWMRWRYWNTLTRRLLHDFDVRARNERASAQTLSGGNQQKLVLARELTEQPALIVAENPLRGLDVQATADISTRLHAACNRGAAVVFYSSDIDELVTECTRVVAVYAGGVRQVAQSRDVIGRALLGAD
ncbi:MAG: ABC transporter ATP-binding protein [Gemmatimonadaceae bacterium]